MGDLARRRKILGFILYVLDVQTSWQSNVQRSIALSNTDAKWVVSSEAGKEVMFVTQWLEA